MAAVMTSVEQKPAASAASRLPVPEGQTEVLAAVDGATVAFGPLVAVRDVSIAVRGGDLLGLIG